MTAPNFHTPASRVAGGLADEGLGKWTRGDDARRGARLSYRLAQGTNGLEHTLIEQMQLAVAARGLSLSHAFVADYYVSLKTNPFVVLTGGGVGAKSALAQGLAEALVGRGGAQYVHIAGGASWPQGTGERRYYHSVLERFDSIRFLELLQEAAAEGNVGKTYFLCLDGLHPDEINHFFTRLLRLTAEGEKRLALPGLPPEQQPVVPANLYITATVHDLADGYPIHQQVMCHAGILELPPLAQGEGVGRPVAVRHPPVGYQRVMLDAAIREVDAARYKLAEVLGDAAVSQLRPSPSLARMLWRGGIVLGTRTLRDLTRYVANSFDRQGRGLFDRDDPQRNAQLALDLNTVQRVVWLLHHEGNAQIRRDLLAYRRTLLAESVEVVADLVGS